MMPSASAAYGHPSTSQYLAGPPPTLSSNGGPSAVGSADAPSEAPSGPIILTSTMPAAAYYTPATYDHLLSHTLSLDANPSAILSYDSRRIQACGLIAALGARVGLPQRTIDTAFVVWHKFGAQHGAASGNTGQQIALAALFVACKLNDTPKKTIDLIVASYPLRFPELVKPSSNPALATIPESEIDPQVLEAERNKLLALEKTMLDAVGYDFKIRQGVESVARGVIKLGRAWYLDKGFVQEAWQIASDVHRTPAALFYPPLVLSLAAVLAAALLCPANAPAERQAASLRVASIFGIQSLPGLQGQEASMTNGHHAQGAGSEKKERLAMNDMWEEELRLWQAEVEDTVHAVLDLYIACCSNIVVLQTQTSRSAAGTSGQFSSPSSPATPTSPASPSDHAAAASASRTGSSTKPPLHASNPPPLGVISWLGLHARRPAPPTSQTSTPSGKPKATPAADLSKLVTESKIALRGLEDARRAEEAQAAQQGENGVDAAVNGTSAQANGHSVAGTSDEREREHLRKRQRRLERRQEIERQKGSIQTLKVQVHGPDEAGAIQRGADPAAGGPPRRPSKPSSATRVVVAPSQAQTQTQTQGQQPHAGAVAVAKTTRFLF